MRSWLGLALILSSGCAQPDANTGFEHTGDLGGRRLQFDDGGDTGFNPQHDLAQPAGVDLAQPPSSGGGDMARPPSSGMDLSTPVNCATVENCFNDIDDDCNGKVNDGCPDTVTLGAQVPLGTYGGSSGTAGSAVCPSGTVLIGADFFTDDYDEFMSGVGVYCATPTLTRGTTNYSLTFAPVSGLGPSFQGSDTDSDESDYCSGTNHAGWSFYVDSNSHYVDGLAFDCGNSKLTLGSDNKLNISFTAVGNPTGPNYEYYTIHEVDCAAGSLLVGYTGLTNGVMIQAQGICAPLVVTYK